MRKAPVLHCPRKKTDIAKTPDNKDTGITSAAVFFTRTFRSSVLSIEPKFGRADMSSLVHSRECAKATALLVFSFGADLVAEV